MKPAKKNLILAFSNLGFGGAQRAMIGLLRGIDPEEWNLSILTQSPTGTYAKDVPKYVTVVNLGGNIFSQLFMIQRYCRKNPDHIILGAQSRSSRIFSLLKFLRVINNRLIIREPNRIISQKIGWADIPWVPIVPYIYRSADSFIGLSAAVRDDLAAMLGRPKETIPIIPNALNIEEVLEKSSERVQHKFFEDSEDTPVVIAVGRLVEQKGFDVLIDAVARLRQSRPVRLMILGQGPLLLKLQQQANELGFGADIDFPGFVTNPYAYLARADVFVLSSRWEGSPNALLEAMAIGIPCVACDCPSGPREILVSPELGLLCPIDDPKAMAGAILESLDNPGEPSIRQEHIRRNHGVESWVRAYERVLLGT